MNLGIFLTQNCNLRCKHCLNKCPVASELSYKKYVKILNSINNITLISFTGGEPILNTEFRKIIDETIKRKIKISLISNGYIYKKYDFLLETDYFYKITFSLNGNKNIHDSIRGKGSFEKVIEAIKYYKEKGILVDVIYVVVQEGYDEVEEVIKLLKSLNIDHLKLGAVIKNGENNALSLTIEERKKIYWDINYYIYKYNIKINPTVSLYSLGGVENCWTYGKRSQLFISEKGELMYCCNIFKNKSILGKINEHNIQKLIEKRDKISMEIRNDRLIKLLNNKLPPEMEYTCEYCNKFFRD